MLLLLNWADTKMMLVSFVQIRRYWTELIDEIKIAQCNLHKLACAKFEIFCCHSYDIVIYIVKKE